MRLGVATLRGLPFSHKGKREGHPAVSKFSVTSIVTADKNIKGTIWSVIMPEKRRYRCQNCGRRFETEVLTPEERRQAELDRVLLSNVACPDCHRTAVRPGWE